MIYTVEKQLNLQLEMDGSEAIMFTKGGAHSINFKIKSIDLENENDLDNDLDIDFSKYDKLNISIKISADGLSHYKRLTEDAEAHKKYWGDFYQAEVLKARQSSSAEPQTTSSKPDTSSTESI